MQQIPNHKPSVSLRGRSPKQSTRAETILEALIAIAVFTIIIGPASALYISSVRNTALNRNDLVAAALADEGVEIVRNIRDTNFLKFSPKAAACWDTVPDYTALDTCQNNKIGGTSGGETNSNFVLQTNPPAVTPTADTLDLATADTQDATFRLNADSPFYRQISIQFLDFDGTPVTFEAMSVTSLVQYRTGTRIQSVRRGIILTNQP